MFDSAELGQSVSKSEFKEREIKSVANITRRDIAEFLPLAAEIPIRPEISVYPLSDANQALVSLKRESVRGAKVLLVNAAT